MGIWEHKGNVENKSHRQVFSTFLECSQMSGVFYHTVIHGLGFFYILYSDKTWILTNQSVHKVLSIF